MDHLKGSHHAMAALLVCRAAPCLFRVTKSFDLFSTLLECFRVGFPEQLLKLDIVTMKMLRTIAASAAIATLGSAAIAGGLSDQIMEAPVVVEEAAATTGSSVDPALIVLAILGLLILSASQSESDDCGTTEECLLEAIFDD